MKLNEIREIVDFMKEAGVCELEYKERSTSIRLKLTPPAPQRPWDRFRGGAPEAPEGEDAPVTPAEEESSDRLLDMELSEAAEKVRKGAVKAGSAVVDTVKAGARFVKSRRDEYLAGTPGAYDVELSDAEETAPEAAPATEAAPAPASEPVTDAEEAQPEDEAAPVESAPEADESIPADPAPVKLDTDAAKEAVVRTAEVVAYAAKAAVDLGAAGVRRGGARLRDWLRPGAGEEPQPAEVDARTAEEAGAAEEVPAESPDRKEEE